MTLRSRKRAMPTQNMATTVAAMAIRSAIRPFLGTLTFVVAAKLPLIPDVEYYEIGGRQLLDRDFSFDIDGNRAILVEEASEVTQTGFRLSSKFRHVQRAILLYADESQISPDLSLLIDGRVELRPPRPEYFIAAARMEGFPIKEEDAVYLASKSLQEIDLVIRPGRSIGRLVRQLKSTSTSPVTRDKPPSRADNIHLDNMVGYGAAKTWGMRLANDVKLWVRGDIGWQDVDRGILLQGPPGCGKTTFARALANACGVPLIYSSAAKWQAEGHLGDLLKAMRKTFQEADAVRPSILFLDEFDSFGDRGVANNKWNHDYKRQVINGLLECLDPAGGREGVVVIAATNDASVVDEALIRPGRLERVIDIPLPDGEARKGILAFHLGGSPSYDLEQFLKASEGWSGADIEKLARDARRMARESGRQVVVEEDLIAVLPPIAAFTYDERFRLAVHEVGHAIVGHVLRPESVVEVTISDGRVLGSKSTSIGTTVFHPLPIMATAQHFADTIAIFLSGVAAERIVFENHFTGAGGSQKSDLTMASDYATMMERCFGFGDGLLTDLGSGSRPMESLRRGDKGLQAIVEKRLAAEFDRATEILATRRKALDELSKQLSQSLRISAEEVRTACASRGRGRPEKRRGIQT
jgi:cell division protease FtsH